MATANIKVREPVNLLKQSAALGFALSELQSHWEAEQQARRQFVDDLSPEDKKEFINGEVIVHSPARFVHAAIVSRLVSIASVHIAKRGLAGAVVCEKALIRMTRNDYEPDICYFGPDKAARICDSEMILPPPDWIVEVLSPATEARDRRVKCLDYAAHGVAEYWIIDPDARTIEQFLSEQTAPLPAPPYPQPRVFAEDDTIESATIPGLRLPVLALFEPAAFSDWLKTG